MEKEERPLSVQTGEVSVPVKPWEIKTVKVQFAAKP
jgi:hypothetical protein